MKNFLLASGFGFANNYWKNLIPLLEGNIFFYESQINGTLEYIGIGHSLGFLKLNKSKLKFSKLFALQGFVNFCCDNRRLRKVISPKLDQMTQEFNIDHKKALKTFYAKCQYFGNENYDEFKKTDLLFDLKLMKQSFDLLNCQIFAFGTKNDEIVPPAMLRDNFENVEILDSTIGHTLGFNEAKLVYEKINEKFS